MHFRIICFTKDKKGDYAQNLLKYDENIRTEPRVYKTPEQAEEALKKFIKRNREKNRCRSYVNELAKMSVPDAVRTYFGKENVLPDGSVTTTYNPNSKYDYYGELEDGLASEILGIANKDEFYPYAFVTAEGEWIAPGEIGWFSSTDDEKSREIYEKKLFQYISDHQDYWAYLLECHI